LKKSSVSVLIASYNASQFLDVTLQGVAWQTLAASEVIIVDDCSTDETEGVVNSWLDRLPIKYIRNEINLGVGASRNVGLRHVSSELIAVLDADDLWLPMHLETLMGCLSHDRTIASPKAVIWPDGGGILLDSQHALDVPKGKNQFQLLCKQNFVFAGSLFPMSMIQEIGDFPNVRIGEDYLFWLKATANGFVVLKPKFPTVMYRRHEGSLSEIKGGFFKALQLSILENLSLFNAKQQRLLKRLVKDLRMRELLSAHDERSGGFLNSAFSNLLPVVGRGKLRLKMSAVARLSGLIRTSPHQ
jgi:glycosyltransferase involved in cell wall biosynthesis